jgi:ferrochelatase
VIGVVVMAYGTPASIDDVEAYYTHIRRGRAPEHEQLEELVGRYRSLGGTSPLRGITEAQAAVIGERLGDGFQVALGQKHAAPFIEDGARALVEAGASELVGVVLAPHYSKGSIGEYAARLDAAAGELGVPARTVPHWHDLPEYRRFLATGIASALMSLPARTKVLFTAHSLPERVLVDDVYPDQLRESASAVAAEVGLDRWTGWSVAWQSAGRTADPWRGPDILEVIEDLAGTGRADGVLVCPQGFVADHLEVLYDLDQQAAQRATALGLAFARTPSLNAHPGVLGALAERVRAVAATPS